MKAVRGKDVDESGEREGNGETTAERFTITRVDSREARGAETVKSAFGL